MRRRRKSLKKFQGNTGSSEVTGNLADDSMNIPDETKYDPSGQAILNDETFYTDDTGVHEMNHMDMLTLQNQELQNALLMQQLQNEGSTGESSITQEDIIMQALSEGRKIKFNKDGSIKKIKKTGGHVAKGKFLRQGGSTGRKLL